MIDIIEKIGSEPQLIWSKFVLQTLRPRTELPIGSDINKCENLSYHSVLEATVWFRGIIV